MENNTLKSGSQLKNGEYSIVRVLGQGGFGITYEAEQVSLGRKVAIKEFFMKDICNRDEQTSHVSVPSVGSKELVEKFKQKFIKEAKMIAGFTHTHIVRFYDVFEENGTAYYVMEYLGGGSLLDLVKSKGSLSEPTAVGYIRQIADALKYLHNQNTLHLDVKPSNILLDQQGQLKLIDFGISKHYDEAGSQTSSTPVGISKGYAPLEQYQQGGDVRKFTPATDIYALGATLYYLVTGTVPPDASEVNEEGLPTLPSKLSDNLKDAITKAMSPRKKDRPQSVEAFLALLGVNVEDNDDDEMTVVEEPKPSITPLSTPAPKYIPKNVTKQASNTKRRFFKNFLELLLFAGFVALYYYFSHDSKHVDYANKPTTYYGRTKQTATPAIDPSYFTKKTSATNTSSTISATGTLAGHDWVDLGLPSGLKWATCNVGASRPGDYGDYFAWGETKKKSYYNWETYKWCNGSSLTLMKYNTKSENGKIDNKKKLDLSDDAARQNWGSTWRMPTMQEVEELKSNCTGEWSTQNGHKGWKFTSKKNGNCIFFPASGWRYNDAPFYVGDYGQYWYSSLDAVDSENAEYFVVSSSRFVVFAYGLRNFGRSIRPVTE